MEWKCNGIRIEMEILNGSVWELPVDWNCKFGVEFEGNGTYEPPITQAWCYSYYATRPSAVRIKYSQSVLWLTREPILHARTLP